ncbi:MULTISPECIES: response regulator [Nitrincola]|uniref:Mycobacterial persistence regulator A n=1 Tax=Nitrincola nitratireducens TaxID=1229521 RepID=W9V2B5_9GAMM|nr:MULTISPECIES: response regulator [Nitrincola]EXJ11086.1 Mycobacterial persistence regulator A [Nitrincola nitratireducens]
MAQSIPVVICDDSRLARKQMARALSHWNVEITQAEHGLQALEAIRAGKGHIMFLDLNMPIMDGYQVLERVRRDDLPCLVIVVSGDIQEDAQIRVMSLGAIGFINKPINEHILCESLKAYGLLDELQARTSTSTQFSASAEDIPKDMFDLARETANVAMGRAAGLLAKLLNVFVHLPVPKVQLISIAEVDMALQASSGYDPITTVCQGFIGKSIAGEALLMFKESNISQIAQLLKYDGDINEAAERELIMDISNVLVGAFIRNFGQLINVEFSQGTPQILGLHCHAPNLQQNPAEWKNTLSIEIEYTIENTNISCDLLVLFTEDSLSSLSERMEQLT